MYIFQKRAIGKEKERKKRMQKKGRTKENKAKGQLLKKKQLTNTITFRKFCVFLKEQPILWAAILNSRTFLTMRHIFE